MALGDGLTMNTATLGTGVSRPSTANSVTRATQNTEDEPKEIWSNLLKSVSSHKSVPSRNLLVMGGGTKGISEFVDGLRLAARQIGGGKETSTRHKRKRSGLPLLEGTLALGYTYIDILDEENDDILARLTFSLFPNPSTSLTPLLHQTFTPSLLTQTTCVILLDWSTPWRWLRDLRDWISVVMGFLHETTRSHDTAAEYERVINDIIAQCESNIRGYSEKPSVSNSQISAETPLLPLGQGEYDEPIGLPLVVVCQNVDKMDLLEREMGYKEELFDFIQQFLRTILLKHGASLHYLSPGHHQSHLSLLSLLSPPNVLQPLIPPTQYAELLQPNVVDRDHVFVPSGWDSWGKIRVLRDGFDVEGVCEGWSVDIASVLADKPTKDGEQVEKQQPTGGALEVYEDTISDPKRSNLDSTAAYTGRDMNTVTIIPEQTFLQQQAGIMESRTSKEQPETPQRNTILGTPRRTNPATATTASIGGGIERIVGVTSVNLGGIEVDVEDVADRLRRLKEREVTPSSVASTPGPETYPPSEIDSPAPIVSPLERQRPLIARTSTPRGTPSKVASKGGETSQAEGDDKLKNFFQSLLVSKGK